MPFNAPLRRGYAQNLSHHAACYAFASSLSLSAFSSYKSVHLSGLSPLALRSSFCASNRSSFLICICSLVWKPLLNHCFMPVVTRQSRAHHLKMKVYTLFTQYGHSTCALFSLPHALHLFNAVTSFNALPAICRCLFFIWLVFFFGTACSSPSQSSPSNVGIGTSAAGSKLALNRSCWICWSRGIRWIDCS